MARKSEYSEEKANQIIEYLIEGKTLTAACKSLSIGVSTVYHWMVEHDDFAERYESARRRGGGNFSQIAIKKAEKEKALFENMFANLA